MCVKVRSFKTVPTARPDLFAMVIYNIPLRIRYVNSFAPALEGCRIIKLVL